MVGDCLALNRDLGVLSAEPELCLWGTLMGNEWLSKTSITMASRGVMRKQSILSTAPPSIIYMEIRCSSCRLHSFIYFAIFVAHSVSSTSLAICFIALCLWPTSRPSSSSSSSSHPADKLHSCPLFFVILSTPLLCTTTLSPTSLLCWLHFFLARCSPGNLIQKEDKRK